MSWLYAFGWLPVPVFYARRLFGMGGIAWGLVFIVIRSDFRDNRGKHEHELEHIEQAYRGLLVVYALRYLCSRSYRFHAEVAAYKREIATYPAGTSIDFAVRALVNEYGLQVSEDDARRALLAP
jgi:hypothetical protein